MRIYEITKNKDCKSLIGTQPLREHYVDLIKEPTKFVFQGKVRKKNKPNYKAKQI